LGTFKVAIVVPAFNEEKTIEKVVQSIRGHGAVIVVNDGSVDRTSEIAVAAGAIVLTHPVNMGYDAALNTGFKKAKKEHYNAVITFDGDGQHSAESLSVFIDELKKGTELVLGIRPNTQRFSEWLFKIYTKNRFNWHDPLCGMKGYRTSLINDVDKIFTYHSIGTELAIKSIRSKCSIKQVNIKSISRKGRSRFGDGFLANLKIIKALILGITN